MISGKVQNVEQVVSTLGKIPGDVAKALLDTLTGIGYDLANYVKGDKLSGQVLNVRTGQLRSSVGNETTQQGNAITAKVAVPGDRVPYAAVHEYGGDIDRVGSRVGAYVIHMPERSYLRTGLSDKSDHYTQMINDAVKAAA